MDAWLRVSVLIGVLDVVLMFLLARYLFERSSLALAAAALLALTPAHIVYSRLPGPYLYPVPFVMAWLLCLGVFEKNSRAAWLGASVAFEPGNYFKVTRGK